MVDTNIDENDGNYIAGDLSLREAIGLTNTTPEHDTISFAQSLEDATISLSLGELSITGDLTLNGLGASRLAISGNGSRIFTVASGIAVDFTGLTIRDGSASEGAGILNGGALSISASTISNNSASSLGGGIYNSDEGTLSINGSTISGNAVTGDDDKFVAAESTTWAC